MSQDSAKTKSLPEHSPVTQARAKLTQALQQLEATVMARMEEAATASASPNGGASEESEQWQNACRLLEQQLASLKDENSQLHSELHQLKSRNTALEKAHGEALDAIDTAIGQVESVLKG
jgi:chromosome segregation ATPase